MSELRWTLERFDPDSADAAAIWSELALATGGSPVCMPQFVFSCARTMSSVALRFAYCRRGEQLVAAAILRRHGGPYPEVFVESQMPLGAWLQLPSEDFVSLVHSLLSACGPGMRLGASQIDPRFVPRPDEGELVHTLDYIQTAWVDFDGTYETYWASRGKNLRTNMRKQRDKLAAQGTVLRMEILTAPEDMARGVMDYAALESRGWKAELGTAVSETHPQTVFYREMMTVFAHRGEARIYRYLFDDRLVATEFCLVGGDEMVILKTTHDETVHPFSPASLLRQEMFEALYAEGRVRRLEFYGPLKDWHTRWTAQVRTIFHANIYRFAGVRWLEGVVRKGLGRPSASAHPGEATTPSDGAEVAPVATNGPGLTSRTPDVEPAWQSVPLERFVGELRGAWDGLIARHCSGHPVFDSRLVFTALSHFPPSDVRALVLGDVRNPRGLALLERVGPGVWRNFQRSQMQVSSVLLAPEDFPRLTELFEALPVGTLAIEFLNQDRAYVGWPDALIASPVVELLDAGQTGTIALDGSFEDYWRARSRNLRRDVAHWIRLLAEQGTPVSLRVVEDPVLVRESVRQFGLMESRGWKAQGGTAVHPDNAQGRFYDEVFESFAREGRAIAYELYAGEVAIARQLALATGPMMVTLKTTYDEDFRRFAPGRLLDYEMLRHEFARRRFRTVELCTRADDMQLRWATTARSVFHLSLFRSKLARQAFHRLRQAARQFRAWGPDRRSVEMASRGAETAGRGVEAADRSRD